MVGRRWSVLGGLVAVALTVHPSMVRGQFRTASTRLPAARPAPQLIDLNTTPRAELVRAFGATYADMIIQGRPYDESIDLVRRQIIPVGVYDEIERDVTVSPVSTPEVALPTTPIATSEDLGDLIDLNHASRDELLRTQGIGRAYADRIIAGRPYRSERELVDRHILPRSIYDQISAQLVAR